MVKTVSCSAVCLNHFMNECDTLVSEKLGC